MAAKSTMPAAPFSVWKARNAPSRRSLSSGRSLERQQVVGGLLDQLARFDQELFEEFVHAGSPHSMAAYSTSVSWRTGLTR